MTINTHPPTPPTRYRPQHTLEYVAMDFANLTATCTFNVTVRAEHRACRRDPHSHLHLHRSWTGNRQRYILIICHTV